jgi:hypothetical protein
MEIGAIPELKDAPALTASDIQAMTTILPDTIESYGRLWNSGAGGTAIKTNRKVQQSIHLSGESRLRLLRA